ncbi:pollen-specific LRR extensin-like protein [Wolffia australiana]
MVWETAPVGGIGMGEGNCSPSGKRNRDTADDEVFLDNFHSHKRYLSELMACSLNCLTVGDSVTENIMDSPSREEIATQYSPMSEDSDDTRGCEPQCSLLAVQHDGASNPVSPVSPYRSPKHQLTSVPFSSCPLSSTLCSHPRRGPEGESRFPSSPNDACHSGDLRRTALLRSVQMRTQPYGSPLACELLFSGIPSIEEERQCPCLKTQDESETHRLDPQFPDRQEESTEADEPLS